MTVTPSNPVEADKKTRQIESEFDSRERSVTAL